MSVPTFIPSVPAPFRPRNPFTAGEILACLCVVVGALSLLGIAKLYVDHEAENRSSLATSAPEIPSLTASCSCPPLRTGPTRPYRVTCPNCRANLEVYPPVNGSTGTGKAIGELLPGKQS
jgi:hypothetical protein